MIRIALLTRHNERIKEVIHSMLMSADIEYKIDNYQKERTYDIYFIEVSKKEDVKIVQLLKKTEDTLFYIIGPKDFDFINESLLNRVHLYIVKDDSFEDVKTYEDHMLKHIQEKFQYYTYRFGGIESQIRLSQIQYIESLRHSIIIHSINGELIERKNLSDFLKQVPSSQFIQIHKSYIVNKRCIFKIKGQELILKNKVILPIGRKYKSKLSNHV